MASRGSVALRLITWTTLLLTLQLAALLLVLNPGLGYHLHAAAGLILLGAILSARLFWTWRRLLAMLYIDLAVVVAVVATDIAAAGTGAFETLGAFAIPIFLLVLVPLTILAGTADHNQQKLPTADRHLQSE